MPELNRDPALHCPICRAAMPSLASSERLPDVRAYKDCVRKCEKCGVGYSNGRTNPTIIFRDPLQNIPIEARAGIEPALAEALNIDNRESKRQRIGFSTSEDALTWTVFSFLASQSPSTLRFLGQRLFGMSVDDQFTLLLWGAPVHAGEGGVTLRTRLLDVLKTLSEKERRLSEPDVVIDYGPAGMVFIEVKLHAPNNVIAAADAEKFRRYTGNSKAFLDADRVIQTGLYELARNWRIGWDLAGGRPFRLVNLGPSRLFDRPERLDSFESGLNQSPDARFMRVTWHDFLKLVAADTGRLPQWLTDWLGQPHRELYPL